MFFDPLPAVNHINNIFDKVDDWWQSDKVINARKLFAEYVSHAPEDYLKNGENLSNMRNLLLKFKHAFSFMYKCNSCNRKIGYFSRKILSK